MRIESRGWKLAGVLLLASTLLAGILSIAQAEGGRKTLEGVVSDVFCGATHRMTDVSARECTTKCIQMGSKYALVVGGTVYQLEGKTSGLENLAGSKAKVEGTVNGNKIQVATVSPVK